jgi:hypothetical protein
VQQAYHDTHLTSNATLFTVDFSPLGEINISSSNPALDGEMISTTVATAIRPVVAWPDRPATWLCTSAMAVVVACHFNATRFTAAEISSTIVVYLSAPPKYSQISLGGQPNGKKCGW